MINSMTGYGRSESVAGDKKYMMEIKSLNHRYLEISLRMPQILFPLELEIRKKISEQFSRGRIEAVIRIDSNNGQGTAKYELNLPVIRNYYEMLVKLKQELNLQGDISLQTMVGLKDIFTQSEPAQDVTVLPAELGKVVDEAMLALKAMRTKEGENLSHDVMERVRSIERSADEIAQRAPQVVLEYQKRLMDKIRAITGEIILDEIRLNQEVAIMAEKSDITEEIVRLRSHIHQFDELVNGTETEGRKIDFLIQEMNREVNTIGSKSSDIDISRNILEIKSELAKVKEQVQNIE
jgi:uncharacterized protein (TIGR00255 family)